MARISELHYSNAWANSTGIAEFLEVALSPGEDPADFVVGFYQSNGTQGIAITLDDPGVIAALDPETGEMTYVISASVFPILLTDPDGGGANNYEAYALVDTSPGGGLVDFYDIGGGTQNILALDGVAAGETSDNLSVSTPPNAATYSIQFNQPNPETPVLTTISQNDTGIVCFASGTMIETPEGPRAVEDLCAGDLVETQDDGAQPLVWVGAREVRGQGRFAPVRFAPGAIGNARTLWLSPQHRVLVRGWRAELLYGADEVLVAACHLINDTSIRRDPRARICYHHILFDRHQVVRAEGAPVESLYPGDGALDALTGAARDEVLALFPELAGGVPTGWPMARRALTGAEGRVLATGG